MFVVKVCHGFGSKEKNVGYDMGNIFPKKQPKLELNIMGRKYITKDDLVVQPYSYFVAYGISSQMAHYIGITCHSEYGDVVLKACISPNNTTEGKFVIRHEYPYIEIENLKPNQTMVLKFDHRKSLLKRIE